MLLFPKLHTKKNPQKGIYQQWDMLHSISSFANDCSGLAKQIFNCLTLKSQRFASGEDMYGNFREWAKMANDNWKTIDLFPAIYMYSEIKQIKQDKELEEHANKIYEDETTSSHLNIEDIFRQEQEARLDSPKLNVEDIDKKLMKQIETHHQQRIENTVREFKKICDEKKYDPYLTKKHFVKLDARIEALKNEAKYNLRSKIQEENIKVSQKKGFDDILQRIMSKISELKSLNKIETDTALQAEFDAIWEEMKLKMVKELQLDDMKKKLFEDLFSVYQGFRKLQTYVSSEYEPLLEDAHPSKLSAHWRSNLIKPEYLKVDHTDQLCYAELEIKLREKSKFFSLHSFYSQKRVIHYFIPDEVRKVIKYKELRHEILQMFETSSNLANESKLRKIDALFSKFAEFCILPNQDMRTDLEKALNARYFLSSKEEKIKGVVEQYGCETEQKQPMFQVKISQLECEGSGKRANLEPQVPSRGHYSKVRSPC